MICSPRSGDVPSLEAIPGSGILLSGRGKHFTAGLDLQYAASQFQPPSDPGRGAEARLRHIHWLQDAFTAVANLPRPGDRGGACGCIGAGVDLASACDLRVASTDAYFQVAEVDVAITADLGTLQRLTHLIPEGVVRDPAYTGRRMDAEGSGAAFTCQPAPAERGGGDRRRAGNRPHDRGQVAARRGRRQAFPSTTAAAARSRRACARSRCGTRPRSAPADLLSAVKGADDPRHGQLRGSGRVESGLSA
jgi:hypothetical protein